MDVFGEPRIDVEVAGENLTEADEEKRRSFHERSPVYNPVTLARPNEPDVTVNEA